MLIEVTPYTRRLPDTQRLPDTHRSYLIHTGVTCYTHNIGFMFAISHHSTFIISILPPMHQNNYTCPNSARVDTRPFSVLPTYHGTIQAYVIIGDDQRCFSDFAIADKAEARIFVAVAIVDEK